MKQISDIKTLENLWEYTEDLHKQMFPNNTLSPIMAGGKLHNPKYMFVFINPTYKNVSSDPAWKGKRRPWTGTKYIWKIFNNAGHFDSELLTEIQKQDIWDTAFADKVYSHLEDRGFYFTNLVKWTGETGDLPDSTKVKTFLPILLQEIRIVQPKYIVTFGLMPFTALTNSQLNLGEYYEASTKEKALRPFLLTLDGTINKIIPCYFPVGRGNPKRATALLNLLPD